MLWKIYIKITVFYFNTFKIVIYSCDGKNDLLQFLVSDDTAEIILICWFGAQETFLIVINVENSHDA